MVPVNFYFPSYMSIISFGCSCFLEFLKDVDDLVAESWRQDALHREEDYQLEISDFFAGSE